MRLPRSIPVHPSSPCPTHRVRLVLAAVQLVAVVENVLIGGVEAGFHAVLHYLAGSWGALQLLDLGRVRGERCWRQTHSSSQPPRSYHRNPTL